MSAHRRRLSVAQTSAISSPHYRLASPQTSLGCPLPPKWQVDPQNRGIKTIIQHQLSRGMGVFYKELRQPQATLAAAIRVFPQLCWDGLANATPWVRYPLGKFHSA